MKFGEKASEIAKALAETCAKVGKPLHDDQLMVIIGGLAIYVEKVYEQGRDDEAEARDPRYDTSRGMGE